MKTCCRRRLAAVATWLVLGVPAVASAAAVTRVATSFEEKDPFGMFIDIGFERTQTRFGIAREVATGSAVEWIPELRYTEIDTRLNIDIRMGLWHDLELRFGIPIVFQQDRHWRFALGQDQTNSSIYSNCVNSAGNPLDPACATTGAGARRLFSVPADSHRGGIDNLIFGLTYAFFNEKKDETKPTWIVGLEYHPPTAELLDPTIPTSTSSRGKIGDRLHHYKFHTAFSKKIGVADPYFEAHYTLPFRGPGWYSNCDNPTAGNMGHPANCNTALWSRSDTGIQGPHTAGVLFGSEFEVYKEPVKKQDFSLDVRGIANYFSAGRYYNALSDLFGKLMFTEDYLQVGGAVRMVAHPAEYARLTAGLTMLYQTAHGLSVEDPGKNSEAIPTNTAEINPNYDFRIDFPSRRMRAIENAVFVIDLAVSFEF